MKDRHLRSAPAAVVLLLSLACGQAPSVVSGPVEFTDVARQTREFIDYERTIQLTAEQARLRETALEALPAPCCSDNTAATCCCPCNMARSIWGLSNYLITERQADVEQVRLVVGEWVEFINPSGFSGEVCYTGGCGLSFAEGGCAGMNPSQIVQ